MGLFRRLQVARRPTATPDLTWRLHAGAEDLEVVGEALHQDVLWSLCGGSLGDRIRHDIVAVLVPEPENPHDANVISVRIDGNPIGYLPRHVAAAYVSGLRQLMSRSGAHVALHGVIVGGGYYDDGPGRLGVWLSHDPADFGMAVSTRHRDGVPTATDGSMRTGLSEALRTDLDDDSYDLSWLEDVPVADRPAIAMLRGLLQREGDPIDRHFQFAELESRLYHAHDLYDAALDEFDEACRRHDAEMDVIRDVFIAKWGKVPLLETYRQMAIRQQKRKDWTACVWWAERGLALYGDVAAREEAVEDLLKRRNRARMKLEEQTQFGVAGPVRRPSPARIAGDTVAIETLVCSNCHATFDRPKARGRKPLVCPACR